MSQAQFQSALQSAARQVETHLDSALPLGNRIADSMRYAVLNGGKRLRAFMAYESCALFDVSAGNANAAAAAIECIHAYSLVHDDLPAMDNDDLRRGLPTVHIKWDDATAVLAGDALQSFAFEVLASINAPAALIGNLAKAAGGQGMVLGQDMDIAAETATSPLNLDEISTLQSLKTGALIRWSACVGPVFAGSDAAPLQQYADALGCAFQIRDDILDIEGDPKAAGKRLRKDENAGKATFVSLLGLDGAKQRAAELAAQAQDALQPFGQRAENLRQAAQYTITRAT